MQGSEAGLQTQGQPGLQSKTLSQTGTPKLCDLVALHTLTSCWVGWPPNTSLSTYLGSAADFTSLWQRQKRFTSAQCFSPRWWPPFITGLYGSRVEGATGLLTWWSLGSREERGYTEGPSCLPLLITPLIPSTRCCCPHSGWTTTPCLGLWKFSQGHSQRILVTSLPQSQQPSEQHHNLLLDRYEQIHSITEHNFYILNCKLEIWNALNSKPLEHHTYTERFSGSLRFGAVLFSLRQGFLCVALAMLELAQYALLSPKYWD